MYCNQCGKQISDSSKFCQFCGAKIDSEFPENPHKITGSPAESSVAAQNNSAQNIRKGTLLYLHDILVMEFSINQLKRKLRGAKDIIAMHEDGFFWKCFALNPPIASEDGQDKYLYLSYSHRLKKTYFGFSSTPPKSIPLYDYQGKRVRYNFFGTPCTEAMDSQMRSKLSTVPMLKKRFFDDYPSIINQNFTYWQPWELRANNWSTKPFEQVGPLIQRFDVLVKEACNDWKSHAPKVRKLIENITQELASAQKILNDLYAVNLIPTKYRNIGGAYFIHDFFSTSNVPLENVFLHLDLDKIQSQLSTVIKNQQTSILQQAVIISQNEEIISQNSQLFDALIHMERSVGDKLSSIADSTIDAAQWAQIAASNAEACAWIGLANYLK